VVVRVDLEADLVGAGLAEVDLVQLLPIHPLR
jgi:hypothetical protein